MKIRHKLTLGILIVGLLGGILGTAATIKLQFDSVEAAARREAEAVATMLVHLLHHGILEHGVVALAAHQAELQDFAEDFYAMHQRDIVFVDTDKQIIADAIPQNVGTRFHYDPGNQVAQTIQDGAARTFVETNADYPQGIKQVVVPFTTADGKTIGAVIFDYTSLYEDLATTTRTTAELVGLVALLCTLLAVGVGYIVARSISNPLGALAEGAARIAAGDMSVRVQVKSNDEIGDLAASFNQMTEELKGSYERLQAELDARKRAEERLAQLNECLLSFGANPDENINRLVAFCGEQLQATCALYNRLEGDQLRALGQWHTPPDFVPVDKPDGHICYDVIQSPRDEVHVIRDLPHTGYAQTDPNVVRYGLRTYVGKAVSLEGAFVGSLCVVYQEDTSPSEDDLNLLGIAASAVGVEEKRKRMEEALRQAEGKYRSIFENAVVGIYQTTLEGGWLTANRTLARLLGFESPEELMERTADLNRQFYVEPGRRAEFIRLMEEHDAVWGFESEVYRKDGGVIWVSENVRTIRDASGKIVGFEGITLDITERKRAEEELVRLRKAVEASGEAIFLTDRDGLITFVNPEFSRLYSRPATEVVGKTTPRILKSGLLKPEDYELFWKTLLNKQGVKGEIINKTKEGRLVTVEGSANPILDEQENIIGFLAIQRDITERKQVEQEIQRRANEFTALYETARDLAAMQRDLPALLQTIVQRAVTLLAASGGTMYLYDTARGDLEVRVMTDPSIPIGTRLQLGEGMAGRVAQTREPLIVDDYRTWPQRSSKYEGIPFTAVVQVPMLYSGELIGVLAVNEVGAHTQDAGQATTRKFTEEDARLLSLFAGQAASAVRNARLFDQAQRRLHETLVLNRVIAAAASTLEPNATLNTICQELAQAFNLPQATFLSLDADRTRLTVVAEYRAEGRPSALGAAIPVANNQAIQSVLEQRVPLVVSNAQMDEGQATMHDLAKQRGVVSLLIVPLLIRDQVIGALGLAATEPRAFSAEEIALAQNVAAAASQGLGNAQLYAAVQQELAERARYEFIVNTSHELMTLINQDRRYEAVNAAYCQAHHKTREELVGRTVAEVWGEEVYQPNIKPHLDRYLAGHIERYQEWFPFADAEPRCFDVTYYPYSDQAGTVTHAVVVSHDITELKRAEEMLRESETRFKSLFEDSPISLWEEDFSRVAIYSDELRQSGVTDLRFYFESHPEAVAQCAAMVKVVDVNKATLKLYQAKSKEDLLAGLNVVLSEEGLPTFREELIAIAESKTRFEDEVVNQTLTGEKIHIALSWSVAPGHEKTYSAVFVSINDITVRKRAEKKLAATVTELEQHNREITLLNEMGDLLQTCHTVEEASTVVAQFAQKLFPDASGALCLIAPSRDFVEALTAWGESPPQDRVFTPDDCWALRRGQAYQVTDPGSGLLCRHVSQPLSPERQPKEPALSLPKGGYMCVPMMAHGETLGILHLQSGKPGPSQTTDEQAAIMASQQQLAVTLAEHIALALANVNLRETLRQQAIRDPLTNLFNRRYMEETLERELRRAERRQAPLGIILFDLDHFKKFNDTFGHPAGDVVLREIGAFLQTRVRVEDIACRYGGEEFLVILPEAALEDTLKRAEQLRVGIKGLNVRYQDQALGAVTVSLGVAVLPEHGSTAEAILKAADAALYRAKREGRDRAVVAPGESA